MSQKEADSFDLPIMPTTQKTARNIIETDEEFLERQFQQSVNALERIHALSPGEFERLVRTPARTEEERQLRSSHHTDIARRALIAAQHNLLSEEEFNIWSGRRKEAGQPVKFRFERAYANICTPFISCQRGALTGVIRAYVRLQDELISELIDAAQVATSAADLWLVEKQAREYGFITFEKYLSSPVAGWPCYPRSTGRFRGATRLRQFFEQRQSELILPSDLAADLQLQISSQTEQTQYEAYQPQFTPSINRDYRDSATPNPTPVATTQVGSPFQRMMKRIRSIFH